MLKPILIDSYNYVELDEKGSLLIFNRDNYIEIEKQNIPRLLRAIKKLANETSNTKR